MWTSLEWIHIAVLLVLGFLSVGFVGWLVLAAMGSLAAVGLHWIIGWSWFLCLYTGVTAAFVLPIMLVLFIENYRVGLLLTVLFGVPLFLLFMYVFKISLTLSILDSAAVMAMLPASIVNILVFFGKIEKPYTTKTTMTTVTKSENDEKPGNATEEPFAHEELRHLIMQIIEGQVKSGEQVTPDDILSKIEEKTGKQYTLKDMEAAIRSGAPRTTASSSPITGEHIVYDPFKRNRW